MTICIFAELEVHEGDMEVFKAFAADAAALVKQHSEGPGPSQYEFYAMGSDSHQVLVTEIYPDADAITQHIDNMKRHFESRQARGEHLRRVWDVKRLAVSGDEIPDNVIEHLKRNGGEAFRYFSTHVSSAFSGST